MLVLSRRKDESLFIGEDIRVTILDIRGGQVRVGITAPESIKVFREEVYDRIKYDNGNEEN